MGCFLNTPGRLTEKDPAHCDKLLLSLLLLLIRAEIVQHTRHEAVKYIMIFENVNI